MFDCSVGLQDCFTLINIVDVLEVYRNFEKLGNGPCQNTHKCIKSSSIAYIILNFNQFDAHSYYVLLRIMFYSKAKTFCPGLFISTFDSLDLFSCVRLKNTLTIIASVEQTYLVGFCCHNQGQFHLSFMQKL